jgi:hypothetical protein
MKHVFREQGDMDVLPIASLLYNRHEDQKTGQSNKVCAEPQSGLPG